MLYKQNLTLIMPHKVYRNILNKQQAQSGTAMAYHEIINFVAAEKQLNNHVLVQDEQEHNIGTLEVQNGKLMIRPYLPNKPE